MSYFLAVCHILVDANQSGFALKAEGNTEMSLTAVAGRTYRWIEGNGCRVWNTDAWHRDADSPRALIEPGSGQLHFGDQTTFLKYPDRHCSMSSPLAAAGLARPGAGLRGFQLPGGVPRHFFCPINSGQREYFTGGTTSNSQQL
jgi:hypothetical protein